MTRIKLLAEMKNCVARSSEPSKKGEKVVLCPKFLYNCSLFRAETSRQVVKCCIILPLFYLNFTFVRRTKKGVNCVCVIVSFHEL